MVADSPLQLAAVVPMHNEAENVDHLITEIDQALGRFLKDYEIVVVDDASTDATLTTLQALQTKIKALQIVEHETNSGQSSAILTGVRAAKSPWIVTLDGDGQNDPADIAKLVAALEGQLSSDSKKLIAGHRVNRHDTWVRRLSSKIANGVRASFLKDNCPDTGCGLKLFTRDAFLQLPHFNHMHRFLPALFNRLGGEVKMVPVNHRPRERGQSKYGIHNRLWAGIVDLFGVAWLMRRRCACPKTQDSGQQTDTTVSLRDNSLQ